MNQQMNIHSEYSIGKSQRRDQRGEVFVPCLQTAPDNPDQGLRASEDVEVLVQRGCLAREVMIYELESIVDGGDRPVDICHA